MESVLSDLTVWKHREQVGVARLGTVRAGTRLTMALHSTKSRILPKPETAELRNLQQQVHARCLLCGSANPAGLALDFHVGRENEVLAEFCGSDLLEGYSGRIHGGLISAILDSAMTNCLFAHRCIAVTAELAVRFRHPVTVHGRILVRAWRTRSHGPLHLLQAEMRQDDVGKAYATGKFFEVQISETPPRSASS